MKHCILTLLLAVWACFPLAAQQAELSQGERQRIAMRIMHHAQQLQHKQQYLEAMDSATLALVIFPDSHAAKEFIHRNWDRMSRWADKELDSNPSQKDLEQSRRRLLVYRYLVEINDNLRDIELPLHGTNDKWVWQPEIQYWDGHFNEELQRVERLQDAAE